MKKWDIYSPNRKLAVGLICQPTGFRSTVRSTTNGRKSDRWSSRSTARSTAQIQRAQLSGLVGRRVDRPNTESIALWSGRPHGWPAHCAARRAQGCARRSTAPVDRASLSATVWVRTWVRLILKILLSLLKLP